MKVQEGTGDTGLSRYPPAEGERYSQGGPAMNVGEGRADTGVSSFPPAEGERNAPAEEPRPPSGAEPTEENGSASPPGPTAGDGTRAGANAPKGKGAAEKQIVPAQATTVSQVNDVFPFPYFNSTGLLPIEPLVTSMTGTLCLAARSGNQKKTTIKISSIQIRLEVTAPARRAEAKESLIARSSALAPPRSGRCSRDWDWIRARLSGQAASRETSASDKETPV